MASFAAAALVEIQPQHGAGQHSLAAEAKLLAGFVSAELNELKLWRIWQFTRELHGLLVFLALFLEKEDDGAPLELSHYTTTDRESEALAQSPTLEDIEGITEEAQGMFAKTTGLRKFQIYKALDVATDNLFALESLLHWPAAGQMAIALQHAIGCDLE
ncbi:unnamed protein product [Cladocopium goreaui]|uniref:Uncharacterized protein n=1 Tax=Cladocopium goreaui TaxID=2562237 RepID=A0A9P1FG41_9DINO|nr:unnamed protein product [Cladocopium goreaui]